MSSAEYFFFNFFFIFFSLDTFCYFADSLRAGLGETMPQVVADILRAMKTLKHKSLLPAYLVGLAAGKYTLAQAAGACGRFSAACKRYI